MSRSTYESSGQTEFTVLRKHRGWSGSLGEWGLEDVRDGGWGRAVVFQAEERRENMVGM